MGVLVSRISSFRRTPESSALIELDTGFCRCDGKIRGEGAPPTKNRCCGRPAPGPMVFTPSPLRGEGGGVGEQRTLAKANANPHRDDLVMEPTP